MIDYPEYYSREMLRLAKPYLILEKFCGRRQPRDLPWILTLWPFCKFVRQDELVPPELPGNPGQTITFRRYFIERKDI